MSWIDKVKIKTGLGKKDRKAGEIWVECNGCNDQIYVAELEKNLRVCPKCDYHFRVDAKQRVSQLLEPNTFIIHDNDLSATDPLKFKDNKKYKDRFL